MDTDEKVLARVVDATREAGARLLELWSPDSRITSTHDIGTAGRPIEAASSGVLRDALEAARPSTPWVDDDHEGVPLAPGEWWAVDTVEGAVNHVHGLPAWCVTVTLIRDNVPVLAAVHQPLGDQTYTALRGAGAEVNGQPLTVSAKTDLGVAVVLGGQVEPGAGGPEGRRRVARSVEAMLEKALLVRLDVPSTFPMLHVATGRMDAFWQYDAELTGIAAGALLITEAGGVVTDLRGEPWRPGFLDVLAAAPGVHAEALAVLTTKA